LDDVDLDWEYLSVIDCGGIKDDAANYTTLVAELREAFNRENPG
jgi:GH18 family chitinase